MNSLFSPARMGRYTLSNRLVMAPMTRSRAAFDGTPGDLAFEYYAQRADIGLIVTEGTQPSDDGQGYLTTPGIYTPAHIAGWRKTTSAVHEKGGHIFIQLMHAGRMSHPDNTPHHRPGVAPSAIAPGTGMFTAAGMQDIPVPRALTTEEVRKTVADFRHAARAAVEAGADGVEIHGANAYLVHQFFAPSANTRTDEYGGSLENRARFAIEVAAAIADEIGADRTAIRLSPGATLWGIDEGPEGPDLYRYLVGELDKLGLAYVHIMHQGSEALLADIRKLWHQSLILNRPGQPRDRIGSDVTSGIADFEALGQMVLANPDVVARLKTSAPMNLSDPTTYFGGNAKGYVDYPFLSQTSSSTVTYSTKAKKKILVVGATGFLGAKVLGQLARDRTFAVAAMSRKGGASNETVNVEWLRGDMMDPASLDKALQGVDVVVSSANSYMKGNLDTDYQGNKNLIEAAARANVGRFVFLSIVSCEAASAVPHFHAKKVAEDLIKASGVPYVFVRAPTFLDQSSDYIAKAVKAGKYPAVGDKTTRWSYVLTDDLALYLAQAAAFPGSEIDNQTIDVGWSDGAKSQQEMADIISRITKKNLKIRAIPWVVFRVLARPVKLFSELGYDLMKMFLFFKTGVYVSNISKQEHFFGPAPSSSDAITRWVKSNQLIS